MRKENLGKKVLSLFEKGKSSLAAAKMISSRTIRPSKMCAREPFRMEIGKVSLSGRENWGSCSRLHPIKLVPDLTGETFPVTCRKEIESIQLLGGKNFA